MFFIVETFSSNQNHHRLQCKNLFEAAPLGEANIAAECRKVRKEIFLHSNLKLRFQRSRPKILPL